MNKQIYQFFTQDHRRIDELLDKATEDPNNIQMEFYHLFRVGLLTHIKMEERILFPAAQKANGNIAPAIAAELRLEHGALTALMVPPPTPELIKAARHIIEKHDIKEEAPGGMYDICESLTQDQTQDILDRLASVAEVPLQSHNAAPYALEAAKRTLLRAGYDYDEITR